MPIFWQDKMSLGYEPIDSDHKRWIDIINIALVGVKSKDMTLIKLGIEKAIEYSRKHFVLEEKIMSEFGYPDINSHFEYHTSFIERIGKFQNEINQNIGDYKRAIEIANQFANFVEIWLVIHIIEKDKKIEPYIKPFI